LLPVDHSANGTPSELKNTANADELPALKPIKQVDGGTIFFKVKRSEELNYRIATSRPTTGPFLIPNPRPDRDIAVMSKYELERLARKRNYDYFSP
jgi:hypothetical protein